MSDHHARCTLSCSIRGWMVMCAMSNEIYIYKYLLNVDVGHRVISCPLSRVMRCVNNMPNAVTNKLRNIATLGPAKTCF